MMDILRGREVCLCDAAAGFGAECHQEFRVLSVQQPGEGPMGL